ncbi:GntR family transcriptional regulator [Actinomycetospora sp. NBRC 106378]|uniref:GntR family transcriptional regulator n=1 Tax=Actinomycetospora sp. NBRC 106378 TaxID=3032208 RepID=UPI0024A2750D|nr:GntR family transcriptional regulator [Actinomycetospora sp. NBRC 106378]GLZ52092.1 GntR family transcriptional regulator [Actinomycetospora sp. NBRC 106378]
MTDAAADALAALARARIVPTATTAERTADAVREQVVEGRLAPGVRLPEQAFCDALSVSRNTLREAFSQLIAERILARAQHRGVFVATPGVADVRDVYRARRLVEPGAVRHGVHAADPLGGKALRAAVEEGRAAAASGDWTGVADANQHFHRAVVGLAGSTRLDAWMALLLAEMRLIFHRIGAVEDFHAPYLERNAAVADLVEQGRLEDAAAELDAYLADAEARIVAALEG